MVLSVTCGHVAETRTVVHSGVKAVWKFEIVLIQHVGSKLSLWILHKPTGFSLLVGHCKRKDAYCCGSV